MVNNVWEKAMGTEERVTRDRLQKLIRKMRSAGHVEALVQFTEKVVSQLLARGVRGIDCFLKKLEDRLGCQEEFIDILKEGRLGIILARNNFSQIHIEYAKKGPDLKAVWNRNELYFAVTRRRPREDDRMIQEKAAFVGQDRPDNIIGKIQDEIEQLQIGEVNIIVLWSDTINLDLDTVQKAFKYIKQEIISAPRKYQDLSAVLFTEVGGVRFFLFKNDKASKPVRTPLARKLQSLSEKTPQEMQKQYEEMLASLRKAATKKNL
jgi:hypothetical protein